jgi:hypothetical protein
MAMVEAGRLYYRGQPAFERPRPRRRRPAMPLTELEPAALDALAAGLDPATQAIVELYRACRLDGERFADCFARLGAPSYAAMLDEALQGAA